MKTEIQNLRKSIYDCWLAVASQTRTARGMVKPFQTHLDDPVFSITAQIHDELARVEKILRADLPALIDDLDRAMNVNIR
jgi:hypothetical protein